jgi:hypothetical protein
VSIGDFSRGVERPEHEADRSLPSIADFKNACKNTSTPPYFFVTLLIKHGDTVYADDVNLLGDNIDTIKKNTETPIDVSKEVSLEVNAERTKYMLVSRQQNAGQNHNIKIGDRTF